MPRLSWVRRSPTLRLAAALAFGLALALPAAPAGAAIEKLMKVCDGKLCPVYRTSFKAPPGWHEERRISDLLGIAVFVPDGETFQTAGAVIYAVARFNPERDPVAAAVEQHHATWRRKVPGVSITRLDDVARATGEAFQLHEFFAPSLTTQPHERVATTSDRDADGNLFVVRLVLTAKTEPALHRAESSFLTMLGSY